MHPLGTWRADRPTMYPHVTSSKSGVMHDCHICGGNIWREHAISCPGVMADLGDQRHNGLDSKD